MILRILKLLSFTMKFIHHVKFRPSPIETCLLNKASYVDLVDKTAHSTLVFKGKNSFSFNPIWTWPKVFPENKNFLNSIILHIKIDQNRNFTPIAIKHWHATIFSKKKNAPSLTNVQVLDHFYRILLKSLPFSWYN